jgi:aromatic ring-cleaving dioxygenase
MQTTALILAVAAVASQGTAMGQALDRPIRRDSVSTIEVQNDRNVPVTVFLERGDFDVRVGTVGPLQTANLPLDPWMIQHDAVQLFVHPEGQQDLASHVFDVRKGDHIGLIVPQSSNGFLPQPEPARMTTELPSGDAAATTLTVRNDRSKPVVVYADHGDFDRRLGTVPASATATLKLPDWLVLESEDLAIIVHPEGGLDLESQYLKVRLHEHLGLRVPAK